MVSLKDIEECIHIHERINSLVLDYTVRFIEKQKLINDKIDSLVEFLALITVNTDMGLLLTASTYETLWDSIREDVKVTEYVLGLARHLTMVIGSYNFNLIIERIVESNICLAGTKPTLSTINKYDGDYIGAINDHRQKGKELLIENKWIVPLYYLDVSILNEFKEDEK